VDRDVKPAALLYNAGRIEIGGPGLNIGRAPENDLVLSDPLVSAHHARVARRNGDFLITDLDSTNATLVNGERLRGGTRSLSSGDTVTVGDTDLRFVIGVFGQSGSAGEPASKTRSFPFVGEAIRIGRHPNNDVVLDDPKVSRFHAEILSTQGGAEVRDLETTNGTRLDGRLISRARLSTGSEIGIGSFVFIFGGDSLLARDDRGALRLDAEHVTVTAGGTRILAPTTLSVKPGEFVAIIGESGAGKSTLLKALAGVRPPTGGRVLLNGEPLLARLSEIGYVPQDEIVHAHLTVREALTFAAQLRLPEDTRRAEIDAAVRGVIGELELDDRADTRIGLLSGGQRKRVGVGTELLSQPGVIFLDEATTGLDPPLEHRMMALMRGLAEQGRVVVTITHATGSLDLASKLAVMGRGGELCFFGAPADALSFFDVERFDGIYVRLEERPATSWRAAFEASELAPPAPGERHRPLPQPRPPGTGRSGVHQVWVLLRRYRKILARDRATLLIMFAPVPVLAALIALIFRGDPFAPWAATASARASAPRDAPSEAPNLLFLLVTTAIWLGALGAAREIVKERTVFSRERAIGVKNRAYLASKVLLLYGVVGMQVTVILAIVLAFHPLHQSRAAYAGVLVSLVISGLVGVTFGLAVSALARREEQAASLMPYVLIPQLALAGALVPTRALGPALDRLSYLVFARWSFQAVGRSANLGEFGGLGSRSRFGNFFSQPWAGIMGILVAYLLVLLGGIVFLLGRTDAS